MDFINDVDHNSLLKEIDSFDSRTSNKLPLLITPNVDQVVKLARAENTALKTSCAQAAFILPDGQPIVWTSRWRDRYSGLRGRLTGSDLFPLLWLQIKERGQKVLFILPNESLAERFRDEYPHARAYAPPMFNVDDADAYSQVLQDCLFFLDKGGYDHVLIGLGFPKQEHLALDLINAMKDGVMRPLFSLLGASFEFHYGLKGRAPLWMQKAGLEFLHRMLSEPGRMIKRYLWDDLAFFPLARKEIKRK